MVETISDFGDFEAAVEEAKRDSVQIEEVDDVSPIEQKYFEYDVDLDERDNSDYVDQSIDDLSMGLDGFDLVEDIQLQLDAEIVKTAGSFIG